MDWLLPPQVPVPAAVVVGPGCSAAVATLLFGLNTDRPATDAEFVFSDVAAAWEWVRKRANSRTKAMPTTAPGGNDILGAIERAATSAVAYTAGHTAESFRNDSLTHNAVLHCVCTVGELGRRLPRELQVRCSQVDWDELSRLRYHLLEHYDEVDLDDVFSLVSGTFPAVADAVRAVTITPDQPHTFPEAP